MGPQSSVPRTLPLFDAGVEPSSWNERMLHGEYAVHYSLLRNTHAPPRCDVFHSLAAAEAHAAEAVAESPDLRCRIYDHQGFIGAPLREISGVRFRRNDMSPRLRRWLGSGLLLTGVVLVVVDWQSSFRLSWPALIGSRLLIPGVILLATEALLLLNALQKVRRSSHRREAELAERRGSR